MGRKFQFEFDPVKDDRARFVETHTDGVLLREINFRNSRYSLKLYATCKFGCIGCGGWYNEPYYAVFRDGVMVSNLHRLCKVCAYHCREDDVRTIVRKWNRKIKRLRERLRG